MSENQNVPASDTETVATEQDRRILPARPAVVPPDADDARTAAAPRQLADLRVERLLQADDSAFASRITSNRISRRSVQ